MSTQLWKRSIVLGSIWHTFELLEILVKSEVFNPASAKFISTLPQHTWLCIFKWSWRAWLGFYRFVWLELKRNSAGHWVPRSRTEDLWVKLFISSSSDFSHLESWMYMYSFWQHRCVLEGLYTFWWLWPTFGFYAIHKNQLKNSKDVGKKQTKKNFIVVCQRLKYKTHQNLRNVRLEVYTIKEISLASIFFIHFNQTLHSVLWNYWIICYFFIYLSLRSKHLWNYVFVSFLAPYYSLLQHWK